jgi:uncharacterized protein (DUF1800 family)
MTRLGFTLGTLALLAATQASPLASGNPFDKKLSKDNQVTHVLNRLTFGRRPGDAEHVRRIGIERWIQQQLHPEGIAEHPQLAERLKPFETLRLATWQILEKYQPPVLTPAFRPPPSLNQVLSTEQIQKLTTGTLEERTAIIASIPSDRLPTFLPALSPEMLRGLPALEQQAAQIRKSEVAARTAELQRLNPPITQLLTPEQRRLALQGSPKDKRELLMSFDADKRRQILRQLPPQAVADLPELRREALVARQPQQFVNQELIEGRILRALYSSRQLEEVLVDFWLNHFNVFNGKGPARVLLTSYERDAIRPHIFGRFHDLLLATARHPAMLYYLDNWMSRVPRDDLPAFAPPGGPQPPRQGLNENYGRELLELHTLGVDGGYTQDDVIAAARCFSGWTIYDVNTFAEFQFNPAMHDRKQKVVLGHTIAAGGGEQDGLQVIAILARHPSTARFISRKLARRFVADVPPQSLVDRIAATFTRTDGDLRAVLETMFTSREFLSEGAWQSKLKSPMELVISAARAIDADVTDAGALAQHIADLGQPLYGKTEPTGYPDTMAAWANSAGFLGRMNFASALTNGRVAGANIDTARLPRHPRAAMELLGTGASRAALETALGNVGEKELPPGTLAALVIASPDFQRR